MFKVKIYEFILKITAVIGDQIYTFIYTGQKSRLCLIFQFFICCYKD